MFCQNCRAPLKLDSSLDDLDPAAFDLLVGATGKPPPSPISESSLSSRPPFPSDRKEIYDRTKQHPCPPSDKRSPSAQYASNTNAIPGPIEPQTKTRLSRENTAMSFVLLTDSQVVPSPPNPATSSSKGSLTQAPAASLPSAASLSQQIETSTRLFSILSSRTDIDHPICHECASLLLSSLSTRLSQTQSLSTTYSNYLKKLQMHPTPTEPELASLSSRLSSVLSAQSDALTTLQSLEAAHASQRVALSALETESAELSAEESQFHAALNAHHITLAAHLTQRDSLQAQYAHASQHLARLQRTNVYNDTFCISHDGFFGTINGLRLGRLPNQPVDWAEINAAWGQTLLLVATVADRLAVQLDGYRLVPLGSSSRIERLEPISASSSAPSNGRPVRQKVAQSLELWSSGDLPLGLNFLHRRFDAAMVAFLECLRQVGAVLEERSGAGRSSSSESAKGQGGGLRLPYEITKDRINGESIRLGSTFGGGQDENWTRACKFTLTCCKFLLAGASNLSGAR